MTACARRLLRAFFVLCLWCTVGGTLADDLQPIPRLAARVTDLTGTLRSEQREHLETKLAAFERQKGAQLAVLIVRTVKPETVEQYALRVVEAWKLGRKGVDDGALLLVAKDDRKLRIEVGYGLEGALNDATAKRIVSETIAPRFKGGDFAGGIDAGIEAMMRVVAGEALPPAEATAAGAAAAGDDHFETLLVIGFVLVFVVGAVLRAILGRLLASGLVGAAAAVLAWLLLASFVAAAIAGVVALLFSLLAGSSKGGRGARGGVAWGGGSWGGSSGGGFSGGGGSFGGGGASGDW